MHVDVWRKRIKRKIVEKSGRYALTRERRERIIASPYAACN